MVKLLSRVRYLCTSKNTRGQRVDYKGQRTRTSGQRHSNKKYPADRTKDNIFLKPKDDRTYGERVDDDRLEAGYRELKRFGKTPVKMVETTSILT